MIEEYEITPALREEARQVAIERLKLWGKWDREDYFEAYSPLERNWQGCIAEIYVRRIYPQLRLGQPLVVEGPNITECDYFYKDQGIELKCNRFTRMWNYFLKNVRETEFKGDTAEILICTAINGPPARAWIFWIFGWMRMEDVEKCEIWRPGERSRIKSAGYAIPLEDLKPINDLITSSDWRLGDFMPRT